MYMRSTDITCPAVHGPNPGLESQVAFEPGLKNTPGFALAFYGFLSTSHGVHELHLHGLWLHQHTHHVQGVP